MFTLPSPSPTHLSPLSTPVSPESLIAVKGFLQCAKNLSTAKNLQKSQNSFKWLINSNSYFYTEEIKILFTEYLDFLFCFVSFFSNRVLICIIDFSGINYIVGVKHVAVFLPQPPQCREYRQMCLIWESHFIFIFVQLGEKYQAISWVFILVKLFYS